MYIKYYYKKILGIDSKKNTFNDYSIDVIRVKYENGNIFRSQKSSNLLLFIFRLKNFYQNY